MRLPILMVSNAEKVLLWSKPYAIYPRDGVPTLKLVIFASLGTTETMLRTLPVAVAKKTALP
jgi:hypothetical protein